MSKTIEEAAKEYAKENSWSVLGEGIPLTHVEEAESDFAWHLVEFANFALTHQWRSVEDEMPQIPEGKKLVRVLALAGDEPLVCWYTHSGRFITTLAAKERYSYDSVNEVKVHLSSEREDVTEIVTHWLPIPSLNLEQR